MGEEVGPPGVKTEQKLEAEKAQLMSRPFHLTVATLSGQNQCMVIHQCHRGQHDFFVPLSSCTLAETPGVIHRSQNPLCADDHLTEWC